MWGPERVLEGCRLPQHPGLQPGSQRESETASPGTHLELLAPGPHHHILGCFLVLSALERQRHMPPHQAAGCPHPSVDAPPPLD